MEVYQIILIIVVIIAFGIAVLPAFNRWQFKRLPYDQQVLAIMKRKILVLPWALDENGRMVVQKQEPFDNWDYPEDHPKFNEDEIRQAVTELKNYSDKSAVKLVFNDPFENGDAQQQPKQ